MIIVRYRHESDENHFLTKLKHMKHYIEDVIECVENKDAEYEEHEDEEDDDYEDETEYKKRGRSRYRRGGRMSRRDKMSSRYDYDY